MSLYVLDTDVLSLAEDGDSTVLAQFRLQTPENLAITIMSVQEQLNGWNDRLPRVQGREKLARHYQRFTYTVEFLRRFCILSFTEPALVPYEELRKQKLNVGKMDLRIAAIALENHAVIVTRNRRDFQRVAGLTLEDWSR